MTELEMGLIIAISFAAAIALILVFVVLVARKKRKLKQRITTLEEKVSELEVKSSINPSQSIQEFMDAKFKNLSKQEQVSLLLNYIAQLQVQVQGDK